MSGRPFLWTRQTRLGSISAHLCSRTVVMVIVFWVVSYCHHMLRFWE
jgi:hypothetical protein